MTFHLLIVDDDTALCRSLELVASEMRLPAKVHTAADVQAALDHLRAIPDDADTVVLSDLDLRDPRGDGVAVLRAAREFLPAAKLFLMSGQDPEFLQAAVARAGAHGALAKPFTPAAFADAMSRVFDR